MISNEQIDQTPKQQLEGYRNALARIRARLRSDPTDMEVAIAAMRCAYHIANEALFCGGDLFATPQGEPALTPQELPGTREPVVTAPQGNTGESPASSGETEVGCWLVGRATAGKPDMNVDEHSDKPVHRAEQELTEDDPQEQP